MTRRRYRHQGESGPGSGRNPDEVPEWSGSLKGLLLQIGTGGRQWSNSCHDEFRKTEVVDSPSTPTLHVRGVPVSILPLDPTDGVSGTFYCELKIGFWFGFWSCLLGTFLRFSDNTTLLFFLLDRRFWSETVMDRHVGTRLTNRRDSNIEKDILSILLWVEFSNRIERIVFLIV